MKRSIALATTIIMAFAAFGGWAGELMLTTNGKPVAGIVISAKPSQAAVFAAVELRDHIKKISGAELPIVPDTAEVKGTRILVGESAATRALGLKNADFKDQEYLIGVRGTDLVLMGRDGGQPYGLNISGTPKSCEGKFGKGLLLDGVRDSLMVTAPLGFNDAQGSMELWMQPATNTPQVLLRLDGDPWSYHIVYYEDGRLIYTTFDGMPNGGSAIKSEKLLPGWHHLLATWDAAKNRKELFVDGKSAGTTGYTPTHCAKARLQIGAMDFGNKGSYFKGAIDEFRLSDKPRPPEGWDRSPPASDPSTLAILHFDEGTVTLCLAKSLSDLRMSRDLQPDLYGGEGTCYAVYQFLERNCGVRWFGPTEVCTVIPSKPTLTVQVSEVRRIPSMAWRCVMPTPNFGALMPTVKGLWADPSVDELWLYLHRMRNGGEPFTCTHSFSGFYDCFWHKNPKNEAAWESQHLEWFAHGYEGQPPQMCYNSTGFTAQVVADARSFFDGKGVKHGEPADGNFFGIGPMDNDSFCRCPLCLSQVNGKEAANPHFSNGRYSDYLFGFCNRVARELRKTHPDKYLSILTYCSWTKHPSFRLEPNIAVQIAMAGNMFLDDPSGVTGHDIWGIYQEWVDGEKGRPIYLWLYPEFPESSVWSPGYTSFPGFGARLIAKQLKRYVKDGIRGLFPEGITTQLNEYMFNQMAFDATQDPDRIIAEFFTLYYGAAAEPMSKLWLEIEETYTNPANWPEELVKADKDVPITEETSWKRLGTAERMARWAGYMEAAKVAAKTDTEKARVRLFEQAEWNSMVNARRIWADKEQHTGKIEQLKKAHPPTASAPDQAKFNGTPCTGGWRTYKKTFLDVTVDSRGYMAVKSGSQYAVLPFCLDGQKGDGFWKTAECQDLPETLDENVTVEGRVGRGFKFDGYEIRLDCSPDFNLGKTLSIAAWVNPKTVGGFVLSHGYTKSSEFTGEDHVYSLSMMPDGHLWFEITDNTGKRHYYEPTDARLTTNQWQHVAATYDGSVMRIYIDGREAGHGRVDKNIQVRDVFSVGRPICIGKDAHGAMDEIRLYSRALNKAEIGALAAAKPVADGEGDLANGLVRHWSFDGPDGSLWPMICRQGFEVKGTTQSGAALTMKVVVTGNTLSCEYTSDSALSLAGVFPGVPEVNWFRSKDGAGKEIQGELWGEYQKLSLHDFIEYNYLERRMRLAFGPGQPLVVLPCGSPWLPTTFTLASTTNGQMHRISFTIQSLPPWEAPLAAPASPVVTRPFDRKKLMVMPEKPSLDFAARKGGPSIFKRDETLAFRLTPDEATRKAIEGQSPEARCVDAMTDSVVETASLKLKDGACDLTLKAVKQGPYRIELWCGGKKIGDDEFVVVGPVEQRKVGPLDKDTLRLREVDRIECAEDNGKHEFYSVSPDSVKTDEAPGVGKFLVNGALPPKQTDLGHEWMSYRIDHLATDKPHLLVFEYPDIADMIVGITVMHPLLPPNGPRDKAGRQIVTTKPVSDYATSMTCGYVTGNGYPITGKKQSMSAVFYPPDDWAVLEFDNYSYIRPNAMRLCRIIVYEIMDDLPMVDAPNLANDRIFGHYDEWLRDPTRNFASIAFMRGEMGSQGNPVPGKFYKWYYVTAERMVKYLRFRGENTWFGGVVRYGQAMYPSLTALSGGLDALPLYARMFEENGLTIVPSAAPMNTFPMRLQDRYTSYDAAHGADTTLQVTGNGAYSYPFWAYGRAPNPLHPALRNALAEVAAELARRYRDYPAVKGVMFIDSLGGVFQPSYFCPSFYTPPDPDFDYNEACYLSTYDDYTMRLFEKQTGIKAPAGKEGDPGRFAERKSWLLANQNKAWTDFRCQAMAETWDILAGAVKKESPRLELYASDTGANMAIHYVGSNDKVSSLDLFRKWGLGIAAPKKTGACVFSCFFNPMNGDVDGFWQRVRADQIPRYNAMNTDPSTDQLLDGNDRIGAYMGRAFFEVSSRKCPPDRPWYISGIGSCRYPLAGNRGSMLDYAVILSRCTPLYICHCWVDGCVPSGHEEQFREFTSAYRTIPLGKYKTVFKQGYPGVTVRSATDDASGKTCFYAVNTDSKPRPVTVKTTGKLCERTAGYPALSVADGVCHIELQPYAVRVFEISAGQIVEVKGQ